ncbi:HTH-type transcriptional activator RhaS [compost metagenome]
MINLGGSSTAAIGGITVKYFYQNWNLDHELPMIIMRSTNLSFYAHYHAEIEFIYIESGSLMVGVNEDRKLLTAGEMVICSSNDIHYFESTGTDSQVIVLIFKPEMVSKNLSWPSDFRFAAPFIEWDRPELYPIRNLLYSIIREKEEARPGYPMFIKAYLLELCGMLYRHLPTLSIHLDSTTKHENKRLRMQQILTFIEENYHTDLSAQIISKHFEMDPSYFCRTFKKSIGVNFKTYLNSIRVLSAERKLSTSSSSITDIALECGFGSIRTFNRVYKEMKGCIPSDSRASHSFAPREQLPK